MLPVLAFAAWAGVLFYYFPGIRDGYSLAEQILASLLFISHLLLILVWCFSGPVTAAVLSGLTAVAVIYVGLAAKDPWLLIQAIFYGALYLGMSTFLYEMQKKINDRRIVKEKLSEDIHLFRDETVRKNEFQKALQKKIDRFLDLHQFAETLKGIPAVPELAAKVVDEAHALVSGAQECVLYLVDEGRESLYLAASSGSTASESAPAPGVLFDQWVMKRSRPLIVEDSSNDFRFFAAKEESTGSLQSVCASPLMTEDKVLGVLRAGSRQKAAFTSDDLHSLDIISGLAAVILRNRLLYERMEELAVRDSLTGLYVNRYFREKLDDEITRSARSSPFSLILLDVDHFKSYNDEFGHAAGDLVLRKIASVIQKVMDPADMAARYGGEEFALILRNKDKEAALGTAEVLRKQIQGSRFVIRRQERSVTASMGIASFPEDGGAPEDLLRTADDNLYRAKKAGRNRVCGNS